MSIKWNLGRVYVVGFVCKKKGYVCLGFGRKKLSVGGRLRWFVSGWERLF